MYTFEAVNGKPLMQSPISFDNGEVYVFGFVHASVSDDGRTVRHGFGSNVQGQEIMDAFEYDWILST